MRDDNEYFSAQDPNDFTLEQRLYAGGLLPGDQAWPDNLMSDPDGIISDWITGIHIETPADEAVQAHLIAQIRRLLPDTDESDRVLFMLGMIVAQGWLCTFLSQRANKSAISAIPLWDVELLTFMEYKLTTLCTTLAGMTDDLDMTTFEDLIKE